MTNRLAHTPITDEHRQEIERRDDSQRMAVYTPAEGATLHDHDRRHPVIQLAQAQSALGSPGRFVRMDTEEEFEYLDVVPIAVMAQRTYWGPGEFSRDRSPLCQSFNGQHAANTMGDGTPTMFPGRDCRSCDHYTAQPWRDRPQDDWCSPGYIVALMDAETLEGYVIRLNGTTARLGRMFAARGILRKAVVRLTAEEVVSDRGRWFAMKTKTVRKLDEADLDLAHNLLQDFDTLGQDDVDSDPVAAAAPAPSMSQNAPEQPPAQEAAPAASEIPNEPDEQGELEVPW